MTKGVRVSGHHGLCRWYLAVAGRARGILWGLLGGRLGAAGTRLAPGTSPLGYGEKRYTLASHLNFQTIGRKGLGTDIVTSSLEGCVGPVQL